MVDVRQHQGGRPVTVDVAVVEAQRVGDHPRVEVAGQGQRLAEDGLRIEGGVPAVGQGDLPQLFPGGPVVVKVATGERA